MKLPDINYGGRAESLGAESRLRSARRLSNALESMGQTALDFIDTQQDEMANKYINEFRIQQTNLELQLKKPYLEPNEIPANVTYDLSEDKWVNGQKTSVPRTQIPTYEVQSQMMDNFLQQADQTAQTTLGSGTYKKWKKQFDNYALAARTRNGVAQLDSMRAAEKARVNQDIEKLTDRGLYEDAAVALEQSPYHTPAEKLKQAEQLTLEAEMRPIQDAAMQDDLATLEAHRLKLMDPNYAGPLDPDTRLKTINYIEREQNRAQAEVEAQAAEANARFYSDANLQVDQRQAGPLEIEQWYNQGLIKPEQRTALRRRYDVVNRQETQKADNSARASAIVNGEVYASPANSDDKKAVNQYAEQGVEQAVDISIKSGILPDNLRDAFTAGAINAPPEDAAELVPLFTAMEDAKPTIFSKLNTDAKRIYTVAAQLHRGGMDEEKAMQVTRDNYEMPEPKRRFYEDRYKKEIKESDNVNALRDHMNEDEEYAGSWIPFRSDMDIAIPELQREYDLAVESLYLMSGGNLPLAQKSAYNEVKRSYGVTRVGGGYKVTETGEFEADWEEELARPMKFPAEKMTGLPSKQVNELFRSYAVDRGYGESKLYYIDDDETARTADNPSYAVIYHDTQTGDFYPLRRADNTLDRWKPLEWLDVTQERLRRAQIDPAIERRGEIMENRAANERARKASEIFDQQILTTPEARQQMQREFFGND